MLEMGGRPCFLFDHSDNEGVVASLRKRADTKENHNSAAVWILSRLVLETLKTAEEKYTDIRDYHSFCLVQAGEVVNVIKSCSVEKNGKKPSMSKQIVDEQCAELATWIEEHNPPLLGIGLNQLIARFHYVVKHEERLSQPDYFALWAWDFGNNNECFN